MARICSVQTGDFTFDTSLGYSATTSITSIDTSKSFLVYTVRQSVDNLNNWDIAGIAAELSSGTQITFHSQFQNRTFTVRWHVVTFSSGMSVQRGTATGITATVSNITLTDLGDTSKCWAIQNSYNSGDGYYPPQQNHTVKYDITSTTNLALQGYAAYGSKDAYWQVVKYTSCSVQKISKSFTTETSGTSTITSVTLSKSFISLTGRHDYSGGENNQAWHAYLTATTTLTYARVTSDSYTAELITYVVSFTDNASCSQTKTAVPANQTYYDVTVTIGQTGSTWAQGNNHFNYSCGDAAEAFSQTWMGCYTVYPTSTTNVRLYKSANNGVATNYYWDLIEHTQDEGGAASAATKMYHYRQMKNRSII